MKNYAVLAYKLENELTKETSSELMNRLVGSMPKNAGAVTRIVKSVCDCGVMNMTKELNIETNDNYDVSISGKNGHNAAEEFNFLLVYENTVDGIVPLSGIYQNGEYYECECTEIPTYNIKIDNKITLDFNKSDITSVDVEAEKHIDVDTPDTYEEEIEVTKPTDECAGCEQECADCDCNITPEYGETFCEACEEDDDLNGDLSDSNIHESDECEELCPEDIPEECNGYETECIKCDLDSVCEDRDECCNCECNMQATEIEDTVHEKKGFFKKLIERLFGR